MKQKTPNSILMIIVVAASLLLTSTICLAQFVHFRRFKLLNLSEYETVDAFYDIEVMSYLNTDYDIISGWVIHKTDPMEPNYRWNTQLVLYNDNSDIAYSLPLKLVKRDDIPPTINAEGIYNAENCGFAGTIWRHNDLRNSYKIGFLIDVNGTLKLVKTDVDYKYIEN